MAATHDCGRTRCAAVQVAVRAVRRPSGRFARARLHSQGSSQEEFQQALEFWPGIQMVEAPPAQAPTLQDPVGFEALSDDLAIRALVRAPFVCHGTLHAVSHRCKSLVRSDDFRKQRLELGLAEHGVVVAGGARVNHAIAGCQMLWNGRWRSIPRMIGPRRGACSVIIDNEMWVMGGRDYRGYELATVEIYSPKTNSWRSGTPMREPRCGAVAGVIGGRLVVANGQGFGRKPSSAEAYTGTRWTSLPPMPHRADQATACVLNGRLYVIGGCPSNMLQVLEMTEENGLSWSCKAVQPPGRFGAASVVHAGKIWVMGGFVQGEGGVPSTSVMTYDADADSWEPAPPLPYALHGWTAVPTEGGFLLLNHTRVLQYKNAAWSEVTHTSYPTEDAACGSVLLG